MVLEISTKSYIRLFQYRNVIIIGYVDVNEVPKQVEPEYHMEIPD